MSYYHVSQQHTIRTLPTIPPSNPFPVQTFLDNFFEHGQRDEEAISHPYSANPTRVNPPVERGARDAAARAPAEKAPGVGGSEHGQESRGLFGTLPPEGWNWSSNGVGLHGETIPPKNLTVDRRQSSVQAYPAFPLASARISSGCIPQHELEAFLREPMPIPEALIVGLGVRKAESGLVQKQKRGLLGLETTGLERLAAVIDTLAVTLRLGRKNAALLTAAGQEEFPAQRSGMCPQRSMRFERRSTSGRSTMKSARSSL